MISVSKVYVDIKMFEYSDLLYKLNKQITNLFKMFIIFKITNTYYKQWNKIYIGIKIKKRLFVLKT